MATSRREEHDARYNIRLYKDTMREDAIEFGDPAVRAPTQPELKLAERVVSCNSGDMDKVSRIDERDKQRRK